MKLIQVGKTRKRFTEEALEHYQKLIRKYAKLELITVPAAKGKRSEEALKKEEEKSIRKQLPKDPTLILLDEKGKEKSSENFAKELERLLEIPGKELCFVIGGAYGFTKEFKEEADHLLSLSPMTFSHQLVRIVLLEQLYRAFSIMRGDPYHNA